MNKTLLIVIGIACAMMAAAGCGKSEPTPPNQVKIKSTANPINANLVKIESLYHPVSPATPTTLSGSSGKIEDKETPPRPKEPDIEKLCQRWKTTPELIEKVSGLREFLNAADDKTADDSAIQARFDGLLVILKKLTKLRSPESLPLLIELLKHDWCVVSFTANGDSEPLDSFIKAFGNFDRIVLTAELVRQIENTDDAIRGTISEVLKILADKSMIPKFLTLLDDPYWNVRDNAVEALSLICQPGDKSIISRLMPLLSDENDTVRHKVIITLGLIGDSSEATELVLLLKNPANIRDAQLILLALSVIKDPAVIPDIREFMKNNQAILKDDKNLYCQALVSLAKLGDKSIGTDLLDALKQKFNFNNRVIADATASICDDRLFPEVAKLFDDRETVSYAARILYNASDWSIIPGLIELLKDSRSIMYVNPQDDTQCRSRISHLSQVCLVRLTQKSFSKPEEWQDWWLNNKDKIGDKK